MDTLLPLVTLLIALSVAAERLVEIVKGAIPWLNKKKDDPVTEGWRKAALQGMAVGAGIITALLARPAVVDSIPAVGQSAAGIVALGLLASGGSGFWNTILSYLLQVKEIRKIEAEDKQLELAERKAGSKTGP